MLGDRANGRPAAVLAERRAGRRPLRFDLGL
jgi:hypothetical protein